MEDKLKLVMLSIHNKRIDHNGSLNLANVEIGTVAIRHLFPFQNMYMSNTKCDWMISVLLSCSPLEKLLCYKNMWCIY